MKEITTIKNDTTKNNVVQDQGYQVAVCTCGYDHGYYYDYGEQQRMRDEEERRRRLEEFKFKMEIDKRRADEDQRRRDEEEKRRRAEEEMRRKREAERREQEKREHEKREAERRILIDDIASIKQSNLSSTLASYSDDLRDNKSKLADLNVK